MKDGFVIRAKLKAYTGEMIEKKERQRNGELKCVMKSFEG